MLPWQFESVLHNHYMLMKFQIVLACFLVASFAEEASEARVTGYTTSNYGNVRNKLKLSRRSAYKVRSDHPGGYGTSSYNNDYNDYNQASYGSAPYPAPYSAPYSAPYPAPYSAPYPAPYSASYSASYPAPYSAPYPAPYSAPYPAPYSAPYTTTSYGDYGQDNYVSSYGSVPYSGGDYNEYSSNYAPVNYGDDYANAYSQTTSYGNKYPSGY